MQELKAEVVLRIRVADGDQATEALASYLIRRGVRELVADLRDIHGFEPYLDLTLEAITEALTGVGKFATAELEVATVLADRALSR